MKYIYKRQDPQTCLLSSSVTIETIGQPFLRTIGVGDDRSIDVNKNNYSIIINVYSINIQSYISYHYPLPSLGEENALSFVTIVTQMKISPIKYPNKFGILFGLHYLCTQDGED